MPAAGNKSMIAFDKLFLWNEIMYEVSCNKNEEINKGKNNKKYRE